MGQRGVDVIDVVADVIGVGRHRRWSVRLGRVRYVASRLQGFKCRRSRRMERVDVKNKGIDVLYCIGLYWTEVVRSQTHSRRTAGAMHGRQRIQLEE